MPQLLDALAEAGVTDDTFYALVKWPPEQIDDFFEELIRSKVMNRLQSFVVKRALVGLTVANNK